MAIRLSMSTIVGILVTLALFYLMQALIAGADKALKEDTGRQSCRLCPGQGGSGYSVEETSSRKTTPSR